MKSSNCLILKMKGGIEEINISDNLLTEFNYNSVKKHITSKKFDKLTQFELKDKKFHIILYGNLDGKAGNENKHDIIPPYDTELFFDDLFVINLDNDKVIKKFSTNDWYSIYEMACGGFISLDSESDLSNDEKLSDTDDSFIINTDEIVYDDEITDNDITEGDFTETETDSDSEYLLDSDTFTDDSDNEINNEIEKKK